MLLRFAKAGLSFLFLFSMTVAAFALSSDLRLIQLVPPDSQVIASMLSPSPEGQPNSLLLITPNNRFDLEDFFAVTGADTSRQIRQVVFVAAATNDGTFSEHSLLVSGRFNRDAIYRYVATSNATMGSYRGQAIVAVPPLSRELGSFNQLRWLAILNANIAIFGTPQSVQQELDRQIQNSRPDPDLLERLSRLGGHYETWCLLPSHAPGGVIARALDKLDPKLGAVTREGESMQYGIHFGERIEITASSNHDAEQSLSSESDRTAVHPTQVHYLLAATHEGQSNNQKVVVKLSQRRYNQWLDALSRGSPTISNLPVH